MGHFYFSLIWLLLLSVSSLTTYCSGDFNSDFVIIWGGGRGRIGDNGNLLTLSLDQTSGSGFESRVEYMFGKISMQLKLVAGNSAGTVSSFYFQSAGAYQDEIDFEFLGNVSGQPYTLHTNIFTQGRGSREEQFIPWFDPTQDFHTYTILWNPINIILWVDGIPIREYKNMSSTGIPYLSQKPMKIHGSIFNGEDWATEGGRIKVNWTAAPFPVSYKSFSPAALVNWDDQKFISAQGDHPWMWEKLDSANKTKLIEVRKKFMIYDYCQQEEKYPKGSFPPECTQKTR